MIAFHLPIIPPKATSQGAGKRMVMVNGKPLFFKNNKIASAEHDFLVLCSPHKPREPIAGPVTLRVDFVWPWRAGEPQWRVALGRVPHTSKPDCSNIIKTIEDCLTKLQFWNDDGQVAELNVTKGWGDKVGIYVAVIPMEIQERPVAPPKPPKEPKRKTPPPNQPSLF
jgi:Holliday junction resolvase RusA-like endonuclease